MSAAEEVEPPPHLAARVRDEVEALLAGTPRACASTRHEFRRESSEKGGSLYGWGTTIEPLGPGERMHLWFDGHDGDLVLEVGTVGWFEWSDLNAEDAVAADLRDIIEAVVAGRAWEYRTLFGRGCEVSTQDGRHFRAGDGRHVFRPSTAGRVLQRRQLAPYRGSA